MQPCRNFFAVLITSCLVLFSSPLVKAETSDFTITGSGWGHGVGLSQYGAKALAQDGASYEEIIDQYFPNNIMNSFSSVMSETFLANETKPLWVGLTQNSASVLFFLESGSAEICFDGPGQCVAVMEKGVNYRFSTDENGTCSFLKENSNGFYQKITSFTSCNASIRPTSTSTIITVPFKARSYTNGILRFRQPPGGEKIHTVFQTGIEDYLKGISEIPESWPKASIEAQVIIARSYAVWAAYNRGGISQLTNQRKLECYCNLVDTSSDQIFRGWTGEYTHPNWVDAVESTARQILTYEGQPSLGLFSSSSGGFTESYENAFGSPEHPYLVSVNDSAAFSDLAGNPHTSWQASYAQAIIARIFDFSWVMDAEVVEVNDSGSAKTVRIKGIVDGRPKEIFVDATHLRTVLSLRSTVFEIFPESQFTDVELGHFFLGDITGLNQLGITKGCTATEFCPEEKVSRAEMAAFLTRALKLSTTEDTNPYSDTKNHFLNKEISAIHTAGITKGCTAAEFCPEEKVSRAEMAAFLIRALALVA